MPDKPSVENAEEKYYRATSRAFIAFLALLSAAFIVVDVIVDDEIVGMVLGVCLIVALIIWQTYLSVGGVADRVPWGRGGRLQRHPTLALFAGAAIISIVAFVHQMRDGQMFSKALLFAVIPGVAYGAYFWWSGSRASTSRAS